MAYASYELNMNRNFGMNAKVWRSKQINRSPKNLFKIFHVPDN